MTNYIVVGVDHGDMNAKELLSEGSKEGFATKILPLLSGRVLVLIEGLYYKVIVPPDHPGSHRARDKFGSGLDGIYPSFGGFDVRFRNENPVLQQRKEQRRIAWEQIAWRFFDMGSWPEPATRQEAVQLARSYSPPAITGPVTSEERSLAAWMHESNRRFDEGYIQAMRHYGKHYDTCVVVVGANHAFTIEKKARYRTEFVFPDHAATNMFHSYVAYQILPTMLLKKGVAT